MHSLIAGCSATDSDNSPGAASQVSVVASHYPVQFLAEQIGGDLVNVETLTSPGTEPHDLELTRSRSGRCRMRPRSSTSPTSSPRSTTPWAKHLVLPSISRGASPLTGEDDHGGTDPHVWLDPVLMQQMATTVADTLAQQDPDNAQAYQDNAAQLDEELAALNTEWRTAPRTARSPRW